MSATGHDLTGDTPTSPVPDPTERSADDALAVFLPEERPEESEFYDRVDLSAVVGAHARVPEDGWGRLRDACTGRAARAFGIFLVVGITGFTIRNLGSAAEDTVRRADTVPVIPAARDELPSPNGEAARPVVPPAREDAAVGTTPPQVVSMNRAKPPVTIKESGRPSAPAVIEKPTRRAAAVETVAAPRVVERTPVSRASGPTTQPAPAPVPVPVPTATTGVASVELPAVGPLDRASSVIAPAATAPSAAAPSAAPAAPPLASAAGISRRAEIESVLGRYANAFSALDARGAKAVWPGVNERNLERAFDDLEQQAFNLGDCEITLLPARALASCDGTARYTPKMGNRKERIESRRWTFQLRQSAQDWFIESVVTR